MTAKKRKGKQEVLSKGQRPKLYNSAGMPVREMENGTDILRQYGADYPGPNRFPSKHGKAK
jgi:hypothetical protein